ncbi:MAG TPA: helix-turn-helix domain-containing protein [Candidatus Tectomicrobia bacterium]
MNTDTLLRPDQVAERLQVSEYTALKWLREGKITGRKLGKFWRVRESDLEAFINHSPTLRLVDAPQAPPANGTPTPPTRALKTQQARKAALLARLQAMQAQGLSTQAMATQLNREGVPTLSGRGTWQKGTIANLLAEAEGTR